MKCVAQKTYHQHCALAHALDLVGDRWTLLIVRDLLAGPRRYSDLADGLVSVPTNLLTTRLAQLRSDGLVERKRLPPPADSVTVYQLTPLGESLGRPLAELARWGMLTLPAIREDRSFRGHWLVLAMNARFEAAAAAGVTESYEFRIDSEVVRLDVADGVGSARAGAANDPAVVITADADTFLELDAGAITPSDAVARGARIHGDPAAIARMQAILPRPARNNGSTTTWR